MNVGQKKMKTIKIKKPKRPTIESCCNSEPPKTKQIKIAKRLALSDRNSPNLLSSSNDFFKENNETPLSYFKTDDCSPPFEVIFRNKSISPREFVGTPKLKTECFSERKIERKISTKYHLNFTKSPKSPFSPSLEDKLLERSKEFKAMIPGTKSKTSSNLENCLVSQTNSLENFQKYSKIWKKIEGNISDVLEKPPEDLQMNSGKAFAQRQKELEIIKKFSQINEICEEDFWKQSLRADLKTGKNLKPNSREQRASLLLKKQFMKSTSRCPIISSKTKTGVSQYFQENLKAYNKSTKEADVTQEFLLKGKSKLKLEFDAVNRIGEHCVALPPLEQYTDEMISRNYGLKILY